MARIIHVGEDYWFRAKVLRRSGLEVDLCKSAEELQVLLKTGTTPDAVVISESRFLHTSTAAKVRKFVRECPVIVFPREGQQPQYHEFDLIVGPLSPPWEWIPELRRTIEESRRIREQSRALCEASTRLCAETAEVRRQSREQRERSRQPVQNSQGTLDPSEPK